MPAVLKILKPCSEPKSTVSEWKLYYYLKMDTEHG